MSLGDEELARKLGLASVEEYAGSILPVGRVCPWCRQEIRATEMIYWDAGAPEGQKAVHVACAGARIVRQ